MVPQDEPKLEPGDYDVVLSMAIVVRGRLRDLAKMRAEVYKLFPIGGQVNRFIHGTISKESLFITKERPKNLGELEKHGGGKIG